MAKSLNQVVHFTIAGENFEKLIFADLISRKEKNSQKENFDLLKKFKKKDY